MYLEWVHLVNLINCQIYMLFKWTESFLESWEVIKYTLVLIDKQSSCQTIGWPSEFSRVCLYSNWGRDFFVQTDNSWSDPTMSQSVGMFSAVSLAARQAWVTSHTCVKPSCTYHHYRAVKCKEIWANANKDLHTNIIPILILNLLQHNGCN
jgi:hypothetical protein